MIQLPSKIRTTLFTASVEVEPYQIFSHENDRICCIIYNGSTAAANFSIGRSKQDVLNGMPAGYVYFTPIFIYGPEPLWIGYPASASTNPPIPILLHGIYHA